MELRLAGLPDEDEPSIRDWQSFHESLDREKGFDTDILRNVAYLSAEIGEVVAAIRDLKRANNESEIETARESLGDELADCLAYILKLSNYAGIDLQAAYTRKMQQNLVRTWRKKQGII
jgi:NTP pyrophosphatase (non-canonical NTP hydrolase)